MADRQINLIVSAKDAASGPLGRIKRSMGGIGGAARRANKGLGSAAAGIGRVGKAAALAAGGGLLLLGGALVLSAKKAAAEDASIRRLNKALKANVKGYKETEDPLGDIIDKRTKLGFADDDLRELFIRLLPITKDVDEATRLQALAMDMAAMKGISVADATDDLAKILQGSTKVGKKYGLTMKKGATETETLGKLQDITAGQAEAFGESAEGAYRSMSNAAEDVMEDVGKGLLPVMKDFAFFIRDSVLPFIGDIVDKVKDWIKQNQPLIDQVVGFVQGGLQKLNDVLFLEIVPAIAGIIQGAKDWFAANQPLVQQISGFVDTALKAFQEGVAFLVDLFLDLGPVGPIILGVVAAVWALNAAFASNPVVLALGAIVLAIGALKLAWDNDFLGIRTTLEEFFTAAQPLLDEISKAFDAIWTAISTVAQWVLDLGAEITAN